MWAACGLVLASAAVTLAVLAQRLRGRHPQLQVLTLPETVSFAIGTICQQGWFHCLSYNSLRTYKYGRVSNMLFGQVCE